MIPNKINKILPSKYFKVWRYQNYEILGYTLFNETAPEIKRSVAISVADNSLLLYDCIPED